MSQYCFRSFLKCRFLILVLESEVLVLVSVLKHGVLVLVLLTQVFTTSLIPARQLKRWLVTIFGVDDEFETACRVADVQELKPAPHSCSPFLHFFSPLPSLPDPFLALLFVQTSSLSSRLPSPLFFFLLFSFRYSGTSSPPLSLSPASGSGERYELLSGVRGRSLVADAFLRILTLENTSADNRFSSFLGHLYSPYKRQKNLEARNLTNKA